MTDQPRPHVASPALPHPGWLLLGAGTPLTLLGWCIESQTDSFWAILAVFITGPLLAISGAWLLVDTRLHALRAHRAAAGIPAGLATSSGWLPATVAAGAGLNALGVGFIGTLTAAATGEFLAGILSILAAAVYGLTAVIAAVAATVILLVAALRRS